MDTPDTERARADAVLRDSEAKQAFLLQLSDTLRAEAGVEAVGNRAVHMIAEQLGVDRVYLVTLTPGDDTVVVTHEARRAEMPPLRGTYRGSDFPSAIKDVFERTIIYTDVRTDDRLTDLDRQSFAGLGAVGFLAASIRRGSAAMIWAAGAVSAQPRSWTATDITLFEDAVERTWAAVERARTEAALRVSEEQYAALFAASPVPFMVLAPNPPDFTITAANDAYLAATLTTRERLIGRRLFDVFTDDPTRPGQLGSDVLAASLDRVLTSRKADAMARTRYDIVTPDGRFEPHWWLAINAPMVDAAGNITAIIHQVDRQTTLQLAEEAQRETQRRQGVLVAELQHRTRNLIAVVRSIAQQTMAETGPTEAFRAKFNDRLGALSRVQGLLSRAGEERISIGQLIRMELDALGATAVGDRIVVDGPEARLRNSVVQTLALAIHELATNARKYGSLATESGTLKVTWQVTAGDGVGRRLSLQWLEEGIDFERERQSPASGGYGRELIERALPYALNAKTTYELDETGVRCTIDLPLDKPGTSPDRANGGENEIHP